MEKELQLKDLYDGFRDAKVIKAYKKLIDEKQELIKFLEEMRRQSFLK